MIYINYQHCVSFNSYRGTTSPSPSTSVKKLCPEILCGRCKGPVYALISVDCVPGSVARAYFYSYQLQSPWTYHSIRGIKCVPHWAYRSDYSVLCNPCSHNLMSNKILHHRSQLCIILCMYYIILYVSVFTLLFPNTLRK